MSIAYEIAYDPQSPGARQAIARLRDGDDEVASWVSFPNDPTSEEVELFRTRDSTEPFATVRGKRPERHVCGPDGRQTTVTAIKNRSVFRTVWEVRGSDGEKRLELIERPFDGMWRRLVRPLPRGFRTGVPDLFGAIVLSPLLLILKAKPWARMVVRDAEGEVLGGVRFACDARNPRDHFFVDTAEGRSEEVLTAAVAAVSVMR